MQASVFGEVDLGTEPVGSVGAAAPEAGPPRSPQSPQSNPGSTPSAGIWIDPPEKPRPAPPSHEERSAQDLAIEILRVARQEVLASANPCAIESPCIVARRAKRLLEDRLDAGAARDAVDAAIDRLVDRA